MSDKSLRLLLNFAGAHPALTLAICAMAAVVLLNLISHAKGRISWKTMHKRPYELGGYAGFISLAYHFLNAFTQGGCK